MSFLYDNSRGKRSCQSNITRNGSRWNSKFTRGYRIRKVQVNVMEHIDVDARYFKKQYDEIGEPPKPGDNWWLDNNTGVATVAAVEPLRADIYNFSESSKITMYDFYKIILDDIQLKAEYEDEEPETEIIVYTVAPEYRFDDYIETIVAKVYDKYLKFQEKFEDEDDFFDALRAAGDSNSDKLIKLAEEIGKDELITIVLDYDFSLKWAINQILN